MAFRCSHSTSCSSPPALFNLNWRYLQVAQPVPRGLHEWLNRPRQSPPCVRSPSQCALWASLPARLPRRLIVCAAWVGEEANAQRLSPTGSVD